jgi:hypothetical protein
MMMMTGVMQLRLADLLGRTTLAGRSAGEVDRLPIERAVLAKAAGRAVVLDLAGVHVLTASYFHAAVWPLWTLPTDIYPILAHAPASATDDITIVLTAVGGAVWFLDTGRSDEPARLGELDPTLCTTLDAVVSQGPSTAADLLQVDPRIGTTAWSNRLAALQKLRLLRRYKDGRRQVYLAPWLGGTHG